MKISDGEIDRLLLDLEIFPPEPPLAEIWIWRRNQARKVLETIIAVERNRLLDECLGICDNVALKYKQAVLAHPAADDIKCRIEALRHE